MPYEAVIGLEVHVQLKTRAKMFAFAPQGYGEEPNTLTDPMVLALPGALPVLNREAIEKTLQVGLMFGCTLAETTRWDRKHYWYPDLPKNYQLSQYDAPLCLGGDVEIELPGPARNIQGEHKRIALTRIHLEEDVGKSTHFEGESLVDLNRAGTPLIEIVSEPAMHTAEEAFAYLTALRSAISGAGISDCDMEKGQLRCDANVSVRPVGERKLGTKVEIKNLNTISGVRDGVAYEIKRQTRLCEEGRGSEIIQETRRWNPERRVTVSMRTKEVSQDYRYFPDPDLLPVRVDAAWVERLRAGLTEMPLDRQRRYQQQFGLPFTVTSVLCPDRPLAEYFEAAVAAYPQNPKALANWTANDLLRELAAAGTEAGSLPVAQCKLTPQHLAELVQLVDAGVISNQIAQTAFPQLFASGESPATYVERLGLKQSSDTAELEEHCRAAIASGAKAVEQYRAGNAKAINALKGPVMKATQGKANPKIVDEILRRLLDG